LTLEVQFLEHHKTQYIDLHRELQKMEHSPQSQAALQNLKTLLLLEIQLLLGCDVEWSVPTPPDSAFADTPVLSTASEGADADDSSEDGRPSGGAASPRSMRPRCGREATATPPRAAGTPSRGRNGGGAAAPDTGGAAAPDTGAAAAAIGGAAAPPAAAAAAACAQQWSSSRAGDGDSATGEGRTGFTRFP
jgi:hypothetical protein